MKALVLLSLLLTACSNWGPTDRHLPVQTFAQGEPTEVTRYIVPGAMNFVYEFRLLDGTRCVTVRDAIACEWKQ